MSVGGHVKASPLVVFLPSEPVSVLPVGQAWGDGIGSTECMRDEMESWRREPN